MRDEISDKDNKFKALYAALIELSVFLKADTVLLYASKGSEMNTIPILEYCLNHKKTVGVPLCLDKNGHMAFYEIHSLDELTPGTCGILEPNPKLSEKITDFSDAIVIVPGIAFDRFGHRLGYGGGYYDRFLKNNSSFSIGLCYNKLVMQQLPYEEHDIPVNMVVTESEVIHCTNGGKNG